MRRADTGYCCMIYRLGQKVRPRSCLQLCQIFTDFNFFTSKLSNKPVLISLLTTPPHIQYVATLPCTLSLMACFADINISRGSVATYARCGGIFNNRSTTNLPRNLRLRFERILVMSLWPNFFGTCCVCLSSCLYVC